MRRTNRLRGRLQRENLWCTHHRRAKNFLLRPDQQEEGLWRVHGQRERAHIHTRFSSAVYFIFGSSCGPSSRHHWRHTNEKLVARRETTLVKFRPDNEPLSLSRNCLTLLSPLFFFLYFLFFLFFRFYVALRFSKEGLFSPPLHSLVVYLLLENSSTSRMQREERRRHVNRFWGMILKKRRGCVWSGVRVIYLLYWNYLINGWKKVKIYC